MGDRHAPRRLHSAWHLEWPRDLRSEEFRELPAPIPPEQLVTTQPASDPAPPDLGRDPERDWLLRYGNG